MEQDVQPQAKAENPLVSVIVRTKDRPKLLRKALHSIAAQTYRPLEVVLVNDGGCDLDAEGLKSILGDIFLNYQRLEKNTGRAHAGNVGIENAKGKYIGFLDDDDEYYPDHAATLVSFLEQLDYKVAYSDSYMVYKAYDFKTQGFVDISEELLFSRDFDSDFLVFENYIPFMCLLFSKEILTEAGGIDEGLDLYEDWDLLIRLGEKYPFFHIKKVTARYNQWSSDMQISQQNKDQFFMRNSYMKIISKHGVRITQGRIHKYVSDYTNARLELKNLRSLLNELEAHAGRLDAEVRERDARITNLEAHAGRLDAEVRERDARITDLEARAGRLDAAVKEKDARIINLEARSEYLDAAVKEKDARIINFAAQAGHLDAAIKERDARITNLEAQTGYLEAQTGHLEAVIKGRDIQICSLDEAVREREGRLASIEKVLQEREAYIRMIYSGTGWRVLTKYFTVRDKLLPAGTKRRLFIKLFAKTFTSPKEIFLGLRKSNLNKFFYHLRMSDPVTLEKKIENKLAAEVSARELPATREGEGNITAQPPQQDYFSFLFEMNTARGNDYVSLSFPSIPESDIRLIAFYLPQFHPIPENDEWWGKGFTEWTNVTRAVPQFIGHFQPRLPEELGFYDLRMPEVQKRQVELAKQYGIQGFCFHFYWFDGKTLLERPLKNFCDNLDFPFCLNWANENWTRRWDGEENEILISQKHSPEDDIEFIKHVAKYLKNKNYIRIKSRPLLIVYRPALLPDPKATAERWRKWCHEHDIGDIYLAATHSFEHVDPRDIGFDAAIEFPPNTFPMKDISGSLDIINQDFKGLVYDYRDAVEWSKQCTKLPYKKFRGIFPSWDNEARKPGRGSAVINSSPGEYKDWLKNLCEYTVKNFDPEERFVFVNAWNEWAEGAYLEPDRRYGYAYLQATAEALGSFPQGAASSPWQWKILFVSHDACKGGAQAVLLNIVSWFKRHTSADLRILCLDGGELLPHFRELGDTRVLSEMRNKRITEEELTRNLRDFCGGIPDLIYCNSVASGREYRLLRALGAPIIMHFHEMEMSINRYAANCIGDVIAHSAHFIAISGAVRNNLVTNHGVDETKISIVYSSITPDSSIGVASDSKKHAIRSSLGLEKNKVLVFGCGLGMAFRKGADLFINAARTLRNRGFDNFHFYWIGDFDIKERDNRYGVWGDCVAALGKESLDKYVTFLGFKDNPREYMQAGDIFLLSSREEPVGLVGLEAAECGLPVICFADAGGMPDFVEDDAGFVVPYADVEAMVDKIAVLIRNEDLRQRLGVRGREKILSRFTIEHTTPHALSSCRRVAQKKPAVSVIIPNYNHARYLQKRLDSVFSQTFKDFEVILLDDASTDNSMEMLNRYKDHADVRILRNEKNSGSPFRQWIKGIDLASAEIIWIAESDDICEPEFLETLLPAFRDPGVKLAYANSHVIDETGKVTGDYENGEYLASLSQTKWKKSYRVDAAEEINDGLGVKDTILNISAVLFRRVEFSGELRKTLEDMRIAGDWYFIVNAIKGGKVHYDAGKLNYHRRHAESVIGKTVSEKRMADFFREFRMVQEFIFRNYVLDGKFCKKWERYLRKQWNDFYPKRSFEELNKYYPFEKMKEMIALNGRKA
jgi:glycosyltransferase involved in cell wall biosynthesis